MQSSFFFCEMTKLGLRSKSDFCRFNKVPTYGLLYARLNVDRNKILNIVNADTDRYGYKVVQWGKPFKAHLAE